MNSTYVNVNGMQHIGVAVSDMNKILPLYRKLFGMDIPFFDSVQAAPLMDVYTHGVTMTKRASMIMNLQGVEPSSPADTSNLTPHCVCR